MGLSGRAVAGIATGCAIGALILGFSIALWLFRVLRPSADTPEPDEDEQFLCKLSEHFRDTVSPELGDLGCHSPAALRGYLAEFYHAVRYFVRMSVQRPSKDVAGNRRPFDATKFYELSGGAYENWDSLMEMDEEDLRDALIHFVCRVIYLRVIPDGDCQITLLPPHILSTYQLMLTKVPAEMMNYGHDKIQQERNSQMLLQYWRAFTVFRCYEPYSTPIERVFQKGAQRAGCMGVGWQSEGPRLYKGYGMYDDDPRMPNILALETTLKDVLAPFWSSFHYRGYQGKPFEDPEARRLLRDVTAMAADLALFAFARPEPVEPFWSDAAQREGPSVDGRGGRRSCFGMRVRLPVPGTESVEHSRDVRTLVAAEPIWNDSEDLWYWFGNGGLEKHKIIAQECKGIRFRKGDQETRQERETRETNADMIRRIEAVRPYLAPSQEETPGWKGATNFF